jgi:outer membrane protein
MRELLAITPQTVTNPVRFARILAVLALVLVLAGTATAAKDKPFGVIDSQRIVEEYDAAKDAQEQYERFIRDLEKEIADRERDLTRMMEDIESQKMLLGEAALQAKMEEFENERAEYLRFREQIEQRVEQEYTDKISPIMDQVKTIVERLGKEGGFGVIIDSAPLTVLYLDPDMDLTNDVLSALARGDD